MKRLVHTVGNVPVPYAALWSSEQGTHYLAQCPWARRLAICDAVAPGQGKPIFGKPHSQRQREVIAEGLCDTCALPLRNRTKVSLSHAAVHLHGANGPAVMQYEPLLHKECARLSMAHCPSLRRDIHAGTLFVRQVLRYRVQMTIMSPEYVEEITGVRTKAIGHAKVELLRWLDRDAAWLGGIDD